jgi:mono/diheme cytochrome c family protein
MIEARPAFIAIEFLTLFNPAHLEQTRTQLMRNNSLAFLFSAFVICLAVIAVAASSKIENGSNTRSAAESYGKYCASCHGKDGRAKTMKGKFTHARDLSEAKWQDDVSDERIFNSIMNGRSVRGNMPAFSKKITEQEAESLVTYVRGLKK